MAGWRKRRAGLFGAVALRLAAQGLPVLPPERTLDAPPPEFLLPYRPFELSSTARGGALPFS
ncbi:MAG TPA: hypothetical protein VFM16_04915 [Holophagaceae bacterium]|nr:hypothetical protein [Holophagaceae bacterium]